MIPFVENSFKHGASKTLKHPWIKLKIQIEDHVLYLNLSNSLPSAVLPSNGKNGIGLKNVQKRLQILYPDEHQLIIESAEKEFIIKLQIPLQPGTIKSTRKLNKKPAFVNS